MLVILLVALVVVGPAGLPKAARGLGKIVRAAKQAVGELSDELDIEDELKESGLTKIKDEVDKVKAELKEETRL